MLDTQTISIVKSTAPLLAATGPQLVAHFYDRMLAHHPELKNVFNPNNQLNGSQHQALFNALCAYANNIDNLAALLPAVERIAQKHTSLNIQPEQYQIVGQHLLATLEELLNPGAEVLNAWGKAYALLANVFIQREAEIYQESENSHGGWRDLRPFRVIKKQPQCQAICSFTLAPVDDGPVVSHRPGQYISVYIQDPAREHQAVRQYSLTKAPDNKHYRIAVKREEKGHVSRYLHEQVNEGDIIQIAPPRGDFFLDLPPTTPVALISAGVGQTPLLAMLHSLQQNQHQASVLWLHTTENGSMHAFAQEVEDLTQQMPSFNHQVWYRRPAANDQLGENYHYPGPMELTDIQPLLADPAMHYYFCGSFSFMQSVAQQLLALGVDSAHLHYEHFGPHQVISA